MSDVTSRLSTALADRYKIERHLGEGGMATVYLAEDLTLAELKSHLWNCANILRGSAVDRTDWKGYILPLPVLQTSIGRLG